MIFPHGFPADGLLTKTTTYCNFYSVKQHLIYRDMSTDRFLPQLLYLTPSTFKCYQTVNLQSLPQTKYCRHAFNRYYKHPVLCMCIPPVHSLMYMLQSFPTLSCTSFSFTETIIICSVLETRQTSKQTRWCSDEYNLARQELGVA